METSDEALGLEELFFGVPPSGGSLEIGNGQEQYMIVMPFDVPPSGGSLEIGNLF